ncbi:hypothetical protein RZN22_18685 [Bacillaceae bacterium S4-13-58]
MVDGGSTKRAIMISYLLRKLGIRQAFMANALVALMQIGKFYTFPSVKKDLATFTTGKIYHADLSASYNIAARYFIRAYQNPCLKIHGCPCRQKEHHKLYLR